ncbi:ABC transporter permease [Pseudactinotalea sp. Z1739]|uniref:ABC transporter permease n=1 Tax=Pseudactinotalea sp. Z1739 TaxID=3413028 RepID=UPI003C7ECACB
MSVTTTGTSSTLLGRGAATLRRVGALARMEATLLVRNTTALATAIAAPPLMVLLFIPMVDSLADNEGVFAALIIAMMATFGLLFIAYYNLTTTAVARREELTLKRLITGEISSAEVLAGMAVPAVLIVGAQLVLVTVVVAFVFEMPAPTNAVLVLVAIVGGLIAFSLFGYASSGLTKTVESAQLTTLPVIFGTLLASGLVFPLTALPDTVQRIAEFTPLAPVVTLIQLGLTGIGPDGQIHTFAESFGAGFLPMVVLVAWCVLGAQAIKKWMRWEPRQ